MLPRLASATGGAAALSLGAAHCRFAFLDLVHARSDLRLGESPDVITKCVMLGVEEVVHYGQCTRGFQAANSPAGLWR